MEHFLAGSLGGGGLFLLRNGLHCIDVGFQQPTNFLRCFLIFLVALQGQATTLTELLLQTVALPYIGCYGHTVEETSYIFRPESFILPFGDSLIECHAIARLTQLARVFLTLHYFLEEI
jgi:hypothetical protein